jgi:hypothetical protein
MAGFSVVAGATGARAVAHTIQAQRYTQAQTCVRLEWRRIGMSGFKVCSKDRGRIVPIECRFCSPNDGYESALAAEARRRNSE